jgi:hypothetical protein
LKEIKKCKFKGRLQWHNIHTKFHQNPSTGFQVASCGQTNKVSPICIHFMHTVQRMHKNLPVSEGLVKFEIPKEGKICLFKSSYMPTSTYGAETWTRNKANSRLMAA